MVSGGSFKENWGTMALIIEGESSYKRRITAKCTTPGNSEDQEAYRSELSGIIHGIMIIEHIFKNHNI